MGELLPVLGLLVGFFILIGVCWLIAAKLGLLKPKSGAEPGGSNAVVSAAAYIVRESVLSPGERAFLPVLEQAVHALAAERRLPGPRVLASVRWAEVLEPAVRRSADGSAWKSAFNRIQAKQADFVLCHPETGRALLVIELDDKSHGRADRKDRDEFIDQACASAGLPILHVRAGTYDVKRLATDIAGKLPRWV